ncbi:PREDICTED: MAGUK p55 subfamily member 7 isoform X2 [Nicrophorus vespilloides]|uniref:MAGUK p55 subfamily member 7 isoform X2 n=1 Tax=Nicrophorus vespilloides TaxID=110193 RepID=A0ABM1MAU5_NICVS|nr:PREDICTED: MAGUK p55 subfamily member 7 isoform X2 [Nicrophorus vespilloides]
MKHLLIELRRVLFMRIEVTSMQRFVLIKDVLLECADANKTALFPAPNAVLAQSMAGEVMANGTKEKWDPALSRLLNSLQKANELPSSEEELVFLSDLLKSKELHALVNVHNKIISNGSSDKFFPMLSTSMHVMFDVLEVLAGKTHISEECKELFHLLQKPHVQGVLCAHDAVAQKDYYPHLPEIPLEVDEDEETIKIVQLVKSNEPLGATIKTDETSGKIVIARVMHGGAADRSGLIHVGDEVVEVNNINVEGKTPNDVLSILQNSEGTITFKLVPTDGKTNLRESKVRVRAHFNYNATTDPYIPCKEAGLDFVKGDVLHIVSQDDAYWWQARKEGDRNMRAGLIPSRALQERRIIHERTQMMKEGNEVPGLCSVSALPVLSCSQFPKSPRCASKPKTKKIMYETAENDDFDREQIPTYEEVAKLYPRPGIYRPLVLIGAPGIGRNELRRRLIDTDPDKYKTPIPYTSRPIKPGEINGKEYYFVSREKMDEDIAAGNFMEYGEYKGNLYGTSCDSVKNLVSNGYVCIINPHYQALKMLRTPQLKPYIIYIRPPPLDILRDTRIAVHARSTFDVNNSRGFSEEEFNDMIRSSARIEFLYEHLFDEQIMNADLAIAFSQLLSAANRLETEPLWVPASWVQ